MEKDKSAGRDNAHSSPSDFLAGGGEMGAQMRAKDWGTTSLGPPELWPQSLRTVVRIMLDSRYSMWMGWGPDLTFFYNDAYARDTLGKKHPWALGKQAQQVWAEIWSDIGPRIDQVLRSGQASWDEGLLLYLERNGYPEETYHTFSYSPLYDDNGKMGGMLCVVTEETDRIISERRVGLLRDLAAASTNIKTEKDVFDAVDKCLSGTPRDLPLTLTYLFNYKDDSARLVCSTGVDPNLAKEATWPLREIMESGTSRIAEDLPACLKDSSTSSSPHTPRRAILVPIAQQGLSRPAGVFVAALNPNRPLDDDYRAFINLFVGQIASALANAHAYEEERARAEALMELDRAKTTFFSNVSHEFRTPLTLMLAPLQDLISQPQGEVPARVLDELTMVHRNGLRLLKLVNALLDFSRIEAGRVRAAFEPVDLAQFTTELASVFRSAVEKAGMRLIVDCPALPQAVYVDRGMWEKVVLNLLSNAFKFTLEGSITVRLRPAGEHVELTISDTGCGIPEHELPRLFERFHRVEGTRGRTHEGTGIGLALVQELVNLHGGNVGVQSRVGQGSTFTVQIPMGSAHLPADRVNAGGGVAPSSLIPDSFLEEARRWLPDGAQEGSQIFGEAALPSPSTYSERRLRILLADDNADMRDYLRRLLAGHYEVETVNDGAAALESIRKNRPDLVLSDVMMPNLDGFGLLRELRAGGETAGLPIILLSARAGEEATLEGLHAGADDYLVKPFSARELLGRIAALLERKRFQRALAAADDHLRIALDAAKMAAWEWDPVEDTVIMSATAPQVYGMPPGTTLNNSKQGFKLVHPEDVDAHRARLLKAMNDLSAFQCQFRVVRPVDGKISWMEERGVARKDPATGKVRISGVVMDVTESKRAEREREALLEREKLARSEAERASRLKDDFLATLSHELRTPLNAIIGWVHLLERGKDDPTTAEEGLSVIFRNARAQAQLIEDLLDMSRITAGKLRLEVQHVDLLDVIAGAIESVRPAADAKGIRLIKVLDSSKTSVSGDPHRLQQIVWNLLSNAIKFTPKGGRVQIELKRINSHVELKVMDNGHGIPPDFLPHVFERFRQADSSTTRSFAGLGLGLAIVKQLVELHGGTVHVSSGGKDKGATFTICLPVAVARFQEPGHKPCADGPTGNDHPTAISLDGVKVLVVDDEPDARNLVKRILDDSRAIVLTAGSAAEAMKLFAKERPHVIVSDIGMPDQDGYDFMRTVRSFSSEEGGQTPAAALTAYARPQDRRQALMAGFQSHVVKPADPAELVTVVASLAGILGR
jgi:PAS domain S-box-containing protein